MSVEYKNKSVNRAVSEGARLKAYIYELLTEMHILEHCTQFI